MANHKIIVFLSLALLTSLFSGCSGHSVSDAGRSSAAADTNSESTTGTTPKEEAVHALPTETEAEKQTPLPSQTATMGKIADIIHMRGRPVVMGDSISLEWSASGFDLYGRFEGDILANVNIDIGNTTAYFKVVTDGDWDNGQIISFIPGKGSYCLAKNLPRGYHTIQIYKRTESQFNALLFESLTYKGILEKTPETQRKIEFVGDSITCGIGYEVKKEKILDNQISENGVDAYTGQTAHALSAEFNVIGLSGWGVFGGGDTDQVRVGRVYKYASYRRMQMGEWDFSQWQPDCIVINLGTNDAYFRSQGHEMTQKQYREEVTNLINLVHECNPKATIVWAYGMMGSQMALELRNTFKALEQQGITVHYVQLPEDWDGGDNHPSKAGHEAAAKILAKALKAIMNWD